MNEYSIFKAASGFELSSFDWDMLQVYARVNDDKDTIEQIEIMAQDYPDPDKAEVGFVFLLKWLHDNK
jgi:hypothetical protein